MKRPAKPEDLEQCMAEDVVCTAARVMTIVVDMVRQIDLTKEHFMMLAESCWVAREGGMSFEEIADKLRQGGRNG